jgi:DNA-binding MarR family transcriptional regulator
VALRLSRLRVGEPVDKAGLAVLQEARLLGTFRPSDLAAQMRLDVSTISRHLHSLEQQGMVQRSADPDDARAQRISITARGNHVIKGMMDHRAAMIRDAVAHWPEVDKEALGRLLRRLADDLCDLTGLLAPATAGEPARTKEMTEKS